MKLFKFILLALNITFLVSCEGSFGEKYTVGNLEVYYTPPAVADRYVIAMGKYFYDNDLILEQQHSIRLTSDPKGFVLQMVLDKTFDELPAHQNNNLKLLEEDIKRVVFGELNFRIEICNRNFVPLKTSTN